MDSARPTNEAGKQNGYARMPVAAGSSVPENAGTMVNVTSCKQKPLATRIPMDELAPPDDTLYQLRKIS